MAAAAAIMGVLLPAQILVAGPLLRNYTTIPRLFFRSMSRVLGLKVAFNGAAIETDRPALYVANHLSYLDPLVLGDKVRAAFIGKGEIARWPLFGMAAKSANMILIRRTREYLPRAHEKIVNTLNGGRNIAFFPEGTTSDGSNVRQFKAGLLAPIFNGVARGENRKEIKLDRIPVVQPFAMRLTHVEGKPVAENPALRERFTWVDDKFLTHVWNVLQTKSMNIELTALPPLDPRDFPGPREMMKEARRQIADIVAPGMPEPPPHVIGVKNRGGERPSL